MSFIIISKTNAAFEAFQNAKLIRRPANACRYARKQNRQISGSGKLPEVFRSKKVHGYG